MGTVQVKIQTDPLPSSDPCSIEAIVGLAPLPVRRRQGRDLCPTRLLDGVLDRVVEIGGLCLSIHVGRRRKLGGSRFEHLVPQFGALLL